jgi:antitoxin HicB
MSYRTIEEYLRLPYTIQIAHDVGEDYDVWFARVVELPGCVTEVDTLEELGPMIEDAMRAWISSAIEDGQPIPEPRPTEDYSGKLMVRLPKSLHRELAETAEREAISLNSCLTLTLERGLRAPAKQVEPAREAPAPAWSRLSDTAWRAMTGAGLRVEAQAVDEELFANWLNHTLDQARGALQGGYTRDALSQLEQMRGGIEPLSGASPLLALLYRTLVTLEEQVEESARYRETIDQQVMQADFRRQVEASVTKTLPIDSLVDGLFEFALLRPRGSK